jgi:hypothetical protein
MCKEMPVIPVNRVVDPKRIIGKKWRVEEEERHKGLLTQKSTLLPCAPSGRFKPSEPSIQQPRCKKCTNRRYVKSVFVLPTRIDLSFE